VSDRIEAVALGQTEDNPKADIVPLPVAGA
jgi:hypothetical protein